MPQPTKQDVHIRAPLTRIAQAYQNTELVGAGTLFPNVGVNKESDLYWIFDKGAFFRDVVARRAPGTKAKEAGYTLSTGSYVCQEYALSDVVPDEVRENADNPLEPDKDATEFVTNILQLGQEIRIADLISTNGSTNWANAGTPSTDWSLDASDPIGDVETGRATILQSIGRYPNRAVIGASSWTDLKQHPDLLDRIKYTERGVLTPELVAGLFDLPNFYIGMGIKNTAQEGAADSFSFIWPNNMILLWSPNAGGMKVPSAGYVFVWKAFETLKFRRDEEFSSVVMVRHSVDEVITGSDAGYALYSVT